MYFLLFAGSTNSLKDRTPAAGLSRFRKLHAHVATHNHKDTHIHQKGILCLKLCVSLSQSYHDTLPESVAVAARV